MEMTAQQLVRETDKIFPYTDKRIEIEKSGKDEIDFWQYLIDLDNKFYELINEMIICLNSDNPTIPERRELSKQLTGMCDFHFLRFPKYIEDPSTFSSWRFFIGTKWEMERKDYIKPDEYTENDIRDILSEMKDSNKITSIYKKNIWDEFLETGDENFKILVLCLNGEMKDLLKQFNDNTTEVARHLFKTEDRVEAKRGYIIPTLHDRANKQYNLRNKKKLYNATKEYCIYRYGKDYEKSRLSKEEEMVKNHKQ